MLSSKDILIKTKLSRATLNNYIKLGLLSKPIVQNPGNQGGGAKLLGYFPDGSLDRIELVRRLKAEGLTLAEIVARIGENGNEDENREQRAHGVAAPPFLPNGRPPEPEGRVLQPLSGESASSGLLEFLSRRDVVIRDLLHQRLPVLIRLAVLVADLQNSDKIRSELPPEEYFELINEIGSVMGPIFRKYYGTRGKHAGDGMVYYFFPQPGSSYIFNALVCAQEVKQAVKTISKDWQLRKNWFNELYLNVGLDEGQEWLGTFQSATNIEFAVLGNTVDHATRLSDFARFGTVWATKNLLSKLTPEERPRVEFGINRRSQGGHEQFVASSYSRLDSLVDLDSGRYETLRAIASLPITEVRLVRPEA